VLQKAINEHVQQAVLNLVCVHAARPRPQLHRLLTAYGIQKITSWQNKRIADHWILANACNCQCISLHSQFKTNKHAVAENKPTIECKAIQT